MGVVVMERNFSNAFTLAEVLVTLGIIGVVSAMTLPTLVKNHQRTVYVTQLQKVVSLLSQAAETATQQNNAISLDETKYNGNNANGARNFLNDQLKIANNCGTDLTPCFASSYKTLNGTDFRLRTPDTVVSLANGASISVFNNALEYQGGDDWHGYLQLQVDVNGPQGPNILGRDLFYMDLYSDGKVAETYSGFNDRFDDGYCSDGYEYGIGCFEKIVNDGWKMDY